MLPNFLGIGCFRCGTTWLHELLDTHPDIYVPQLRKEVHFFREANYDKGLTWYERFFPPDAQADQYCAVGEVGPGYIYEPACIPRVKKVAQINKLIVMFRNPVTRAYSGHLWGQKVRAKTRTFDEAVRYMIQRNSGTDQGLYDQWLRPWLEQFDRRQVLVLIMEEVFADVPRARQTIADFLGVDAQRFPPEAGVKRVNEGQVPRHKQLYRWATRVNLLLRQWHMDRLVNRLKKAGIMRLVGMEKAANKAPPMSTETRQLLEAYYAPHIDRLEAMLEIDLSLWRPKPTPSTVSEATNQPS